MKNYPIIKKGMADIKIQLWRVVAIFLALGVLYMIWMSATPKPDFDVTLQSAKPSQQDVPRSLPYNNSVCLTGLKRKKRLPDAILIGNRKAGTRAILSFLSVLNPLVKEPPGGEVHFFDDNLSKGLKYYKSLMPMVCPGELVVEKTPEYFRTPRVPREVYKWKKNIRLMLALRDPIERTVSDFYMYVRDTLGGEVGNLTFEDQIFNKDGSINTKCNHIRWSLADEMLGWWLKYFCINQFHFIDSGVFTHDNPANELQKIEVFLGLKPKIKESDFLFDAERGYYRMKGEVPKLLKGKGHQHPEIKDLTRERLLHFYAPHVQKLRDMMGRKLSWMDKYLDVKIKY